MFLNKSKFIESLFQLFKEAESELILIVPYIKMSKAVFSALLECDKRNVQILIVCRQDCLSNDQLYKLNGLTNLTLLSHPNLHSKIYLNQNNIILGSMNLYEYSEKFNREAGILFPTFDSWNLDVAEDCKAEIREIISGSREIIVSETVRSKGVNFKIITSEEDKLLEKARQLSKFFTTKTFNLKNTNEGFYPTCISFYDNIDVVISNRIVILPKYSEHLNHKVFEQYHNISEDKFAPFRLYNDNRNHKFMLYAAKGDSISNHIYSDREYAKTIEKTVMDFCEELNSIYRQFK